MRSTRRTKQDGTQLLLPSSPPLSGATQVEQLSPPPQVNVLEAASSDLSSSSGPPPVSEQELSSPEFAPYALDPSLGGEPKSSIDSWSSYLHSACLGTDPLSPDASSLETYLNLESTAQEPSSYLLPSSFDPLPSNDAPSIDPIVFNASLDSPLELSPYDGTVDPSEIGSSPYFDTEDAMHLPPFDWSLPLFPSIESATGVGASDEGAGGSNEGAGGSNEMGGVVSPHEVSPVPTSRISSPEPELMDKDDDEYRPTTPAPSDDDSLPSTRSGSRKRRASSAAPRDPSTQKRVFTGSRSAPITSLIPSDAPIQSRTYLLPSSTSRKALPIAVSRSLPRTAGTRRKKVPAIEEGAPEASELPEEIVLTVEAKRSQNTLAARKSRERKARYLAELESRVDEQEGEIGELKREVERLKRLCGEE